MFNKGFNYLLVDKAEAIRYFSQSLEADSTFSLAYYYRGLARYKMGNYPRALSDFKQALRYDTHMIKCYMYQGFTYRQLNQPKLALAAFKQYLELTPSINKSDYLVMAKATAAAGHPKEALVYYEKAVEETPTEAQLYRLFLATYDEGNYKKALQLIEDIISINPSFYGYYIHKGKVELKLKKPNNALHNFDMAMGLNRQVADTYFLKGTVLDTLGRFEEALQHYTAAIQLNPTDGTYYSKRGNIKITLGNKEGACLDWTIAGKLGYYADFDKIKTVCQQTTIYSK